MPAQTINITIPQRPIPRAEYDLLHKYFVKSTDYSVIKTPNALITEGKKLAPSLTDSQIFALRSSIMKNKIIKRFGYLGRIAALAAKGYAAGKSIIELSNAYDFSPLHLLRAVLLYEKRKPNARDKEQLALAMRNDIASSDKERETAERAEAAERRFVEYISSQGVKLKTQNELVEEQKKKYGRAHLTPDILFSEPVLINGIEMNWLEFKNYVGAPIGFISKSNAKQAKKYKQAFGAGAMCYSCSYVAGYSIKDVYILDVSSIFEQ